MRLPRAAEAGEAGMGLTPLVDVIFLLLIFFVVATTFKEQHLALELPDVLEAAAEAPQEMLVVELAASGETLVDGEPVDGAEIGDAIADRAADAAALELRADGQVLHERVVEVLGHAQAHDLTEISIAVDAARTSE